MKLSQYRINVINITTQPHSPENYLKKLLHNHQLKQNILVLIIFL